MSKYSIFATKQDYKEMYEVLKNLEFKYNMPLDWVKVKRDSLDSLSALPSIMERAFNRRQLNKQKLNRGVKTP